jgi:hypothetical protein
LKNISNPVLEQNFAEGIFNLSGGVSSFSRCFQHETTLGGPIIFGSFGATFLIEQYGG